MSRQLWKLTAEPTVDEAHFEAKLRLNIESVRRDAERVIKRAMAAAATQWRRER